MSTSRQPENRRVVRKGDAGFSLLEMAFVVVIGIIMTAIAVPLVNHVMSGYRLRGPHPRLPAAFKARVIRPSSTAIRSGW